MRPTDRLVSSHSLKYVDLVNCFHVLSDATYHFLDGEYKQYEGIIYGFSYLIPYNIVVNYLKK